MTGKFYRQWGSGDGCGNGVERRDGDGLGWSGGVGWCNGDGVPTERVHQLVLHLNLQLSGSQYCDNYSPIHILLVSSFLCIKHEHKVTMTIM